MAGLNPVRYPGGKGRRSIVDRVLSLYPDGSLDGVTWVEPFCGGCGLGLALVDRGVVGSAMFNDGDHRIASMWRAMAYQTDDFVRWIDGVSVDMGTFREMRRVANDPDVGSFERGTATYFLNRTCRSGYIDGGVIGGNDQSGRYQMDCRFNKPELERRVRRIGELAADGRVRFVGPYDAITLVRLLCDAYATDTDSASDDVAGGVRTMPYEDVLGVPDGGELFLYADPPYVVKGAACYRRGVDHDELARCLHDVSDMGVRWLCSYDDCERVRELYAGYRMEPLSITYSNNDRTRGRTDELLIMSERERA